MNAYLAAVFTRLASIHVHPLDAKTGHSARRIIIQRRPRCRKGRAPVLSVGEMGTGRGIILDNEMKVSGLLSGCRHVFRRSRDLLSCLHLRKLFPRLV